MSRSFFESVHCLSKVHCKACRLNRDWRASFVGHYDVPDVDFDCPYGETSESVMRLPSLPRQALNFAAAMWRTVLSGITSWRLKASPRERRRRQEICHGKAIECYREHDKRCSRCGCYVPAKAALKAEFCPNGYW